MESINVFDLEAKITLDDSGYSQSLDDAGEKTSSFGEKLKGGLATAAKVGAAALGAAATGIVALGKQAIESYAEYEQLVGGVETLFKDSADAVISNAERAYQTAGLSMNEYMETVTGMSAALINSLGGDTVAAAAAADRAITDMADNANKMGTSIESLQTAYAGFSKQNYTMLDNLKLGYGGTKEEMERLLQDAEAFNAEMGNIVDYDINNFADIVEAIGVIQDKMGITGATAAEASTTIQGSVAAMKAAWQNFLTGMADPTQDFGALVGNLVDSVVTVGENLIPRIVELAPRLTEGLEALVSAALPQIPVLLETLLPTLISSASSLLASFTSLLPSILTSALAALPQLVDAAITIASNLLNALVQAAPTLLKAAPVLISELVSGISSALPMILEAGFTLLEVLTNGIIEGLPAMIEELPQIIDGFLGFLDENLGAILEQGITILGELAFGIISAIPDLVSKLPQIITSFVNFIVENLPTIATQGGKLLGELIVGILGAIPELIAAIPEIITAIVNGLSSGWDALKEVGANLLTGLWEGIQSKFAWLKEKAMGLINTVKSWFTGAQGFDTHSPSKWSEKVFRYVMEGGGIGLENGLPSVMRHVNHVGEAIKDGLAVSTTLPGVSVSDRQIQAMSGLTGAVLANGSSGGNYEIVLNVGDAELARVLFDPLKAVVVQRGESFA